MMVKGHSSFSRTPELQLHHRLQLASCPQVKQLMSPMNFCTNDSHMLSDNIAVVLLIYFSCYCIVTKVKNIRQWGTHTPSAKAQHKTVNFTLLHDTERGDGVQCWKSFCSQKTTKWPMQRGCAWHSLSCMALNWMFLIK